MAYPQYGLESPSEALGEQSKFSQSIDKNGQHIAHCVFRERGFEPWPKKYLKYILMEWYIFLNERQCLPGTWDCPLPSCEERNGTFAYVIDHLEKCPHLKTDTRQYTCPGCQTDVEMPAHTCSGCQTDARLPAMSPGMKAMLKIRDSFENLLVHCSPRSRPSSAGSSPISPLAPHAGSFQERDQALLMQYAAGNGMATAQAPNHLSQHNRTHTVERIVTQFDPTPPPPPVFEFDAYSKNPCPSSRSGSSSCESGQSSKLSAQEAPSASSISQLTWSPTDVAWVGPPNLGDPNPPPWTNYIHPSCNLQQVGAFPCGPEYPELPDNGFLQGMPSFPFHNNANIPCSAVEKECHMQAELMSLHQFQWGQQEGSSSFVPELPVDPFQQAYPVLELASSPDLAHELSSPPSTDVDMTDTPPTSDNSSPTAVDGSELQCEICQWEPDKRGKRSFDKLRLAVDKHRKRNHLSRDYHCKVCNRSFKNRQDNVKPHVRRAHPNEFPGIYPDTPAQQDGPQSGDKAKATAKPASRRRESVPTPKSKAFPGRGRQVRLHSR